MTKSSTVVEKDEHASEKWSRGGLKSALYDHTIDFKVLVLAWQFTFPKGAEVA